MFKNKNSHFLQKLPPFIFHFNIVWDLRRISQMRLYGIYNGLYFLPHDGSTFALVNFDPSGSQCLRKTYFSIRTGLHEFHLGYSFVRDGVINNCFVAAMFYYVLSLSGSFRRIEIEREKDR